MIEPTAYLNVNVPAPGSGATGTDKASSSLDKDGFLKLLSAQMRNQDPQSSQDPNQYFQTISQMTVVEQITNLAASTAAGLDQQQIAIVTPMIGRQVTYRDDHGDAHTGTVESVQVAGGKPTVTIDGVSGISPSKFTEVR